MKYKDAMTNVFFICKQEYGGKLQLFYRMVIQFYSYSGNTIVGQSLLPRKAEIGEWKGHELNICTVLSFSTLSHFVLLFFLSCEVNSREFGNKRNWSGNCIDNGWWSETSTYNHLRPPVTSHLMPDTFLHIAVAVPLHACLMSRFVSLCFNSPP